MPISSFSFFMQFLQFYIRLPYQNTGKQKCLLIYGTFDFQNFLHVIYIYNKTCQDEIANDRSKNSI